MELSSRVKNVSSSLTLAITARAKKMKANGVDVIGFGSGEPDFDTPLYIKEAAIKAIRENFTRYTPASGTDELKEIICKKFSRENNLSYNPSNIVVSCGAKHSIYNIIQAICNKGDEVIILSPYWLSYPEMVILAEARPVFIETGENDSFKVPPDILKKSITKKTKLLILNSPSNPTGCVYNAGELKQIGEIASERNILVISDEIYEKIIFDGEAHVSVASMGEKIFKNTVVVNGVSKSFAMTGWRIGYLASPCDDLVNAVKNLQSHSTSNPASISQAAAAEAIKTSGDSAMLNMVREFEKRRDYIVDRVNGIKGLSCTKPQGAFYIFARITKKGLSSMEAAERLLDEANVAVVPGKVFGSDRHIRLSFATNIENIRKGMDRIEKWFAEV